MESPLPPPLTEAIRPSATSLPSRLFNMFATPGEVFEDVKASPPSTANWLAPVLLASVVGIIHVLVVFSQDTVLHQMREQREKAMEKSLEKLPKEKRDKTIEMTEKFFTPTFFKLLGSLSAVAGSFGWVFFMAVVMWLLGTKVFKHDFPFMKAAEVAGLCAMISVLGSIVSMLLIVVTGNMLITPGPDLLVSNFDAANKIHRGLAALNVMTIWYISVLALGLSRLSRASWGKALLWLAIPWAVIQTGMILLGFGPRGM